MRDPFPNTYLRRQWHQSEEARELLSDQRIGLLDEIMDHADALLDVKESLRHIISWSEYTMVDLLFLWLEVLVTARSFGNPTFIPMLRTVLWAFENHKPITVQTQHQAEVSIALMQKVIRHKIYFGALKDAKYMLMNIFIYTKCPNLCVRSFLKNTQGV